MSLGSSQKWREATPHRRCARDASGGLRLSFADVRQFVWPRQHHSQPWRGGGRGDRRGLSSTRNRTNQASAPSCVRARELIGRNCSALRQTVVSKKIDVATRVRLIINFCLRNWALNPIRIALSTYLGRPRRFHAPGSFLLPPALAPKLAGS